MKPTDDNLHDLPELSHWVGGTVWARCPRCQRTVSLAPTQSGTSLEATTDSGFERLRLVATIGAVATHTCGSEESALSAPTGEGDRDEVEVPCGRTVWVSDDDPTAVEDHHYKCPDCPAAPTGEGNRG